MCGDFDDHERFDEELFDEFIHKLTHLGIRPDPDAEGTPPRLDSEDIRATYMESLFKAGLTRCANDAASMPMGEHMDALAGQAIVFARLAGFLAAQFPSSADQFRSVITAVIDSHSEHTAAR